MVVNSLNDLSITIHEIGKRYNIQDYIDEFKSSMTSEVNSKFWDEFDGLRSTTASEVVNPLEKIMLLSSVITDDELEKVSKINKRLDLKYSYTDFVKECESARQAFLRGAQILLLHEGGEEAQRGKRQRWLGNLLRHHGHDRCHACRMVGFSA